MTFVVVQHLSPDYKSMMVELLDRRTSLTVQKVADGIIPKAEHVYVIEPQTSIRLEGGKLRIETTERDARTPHSISDFFESVASGNEGGCVGVVLSGTGSDGARGVEVIKDAGGTVVVQEPASAAFNGMPLAALSTGTADIVVPPQNMILELMRLQESGAAAYFGLAGDHGSAVLAQLVAVLKKRTGINFNHYKATTIVRRIQRRMSYVGLEDPREYVDRLRDDETETAALYKDLLIGVTKFHRDAGAVAALQATAIPRLLSQPSTAPVRAWVAGCSTGEEAYTVAMLLTEAIIARGIDRELRIFATDVDSRALQVASAGEFSAESIAHLPPDLVARYFINRRGVYTAQPVLRDPILFSRHDVIEDPPFSRLDFVSCRNLLIYLRPVVQQRILRMFSQCLLDDGIMWLGSSETLGQSESLFQTLESRWRIYAARPGRRKHVVPPLRVVTPPAPVGQAVPRDSKLLRALGAALTNYAPPTLMINERFEVVYRYGDLELLKLPYGEVSLDVRELLPMELSSIISTAVGRLKDIEEDLVYRNLRAGDDEQARQFDLRIRLLESKGSEVLIALVFERLTEPIAEEVVVTPESFPGEIEAELQQTRRALADTRANLQTTIEELESSNEELQSTNEELYASNEELQSTNEELQSVNEELRMVNDEHQAKVEELKQVNRTLDAVLGGIDVGILLVDNQLVLSRFNTSATLFLNARSVDIGRPLSHLTHRLAFPDLLDRIGDVIRGGAPIERSVATTDGNSQVLVRIRPRGDAQREEALITVTEVTSLVDAQRSAAQFKAAFDASEHCVAILQTNGSLAAFSKSFATLMDRDPAYLENGSIFELLGEDSGDCIRVLLKQVPDKGRWSGILRFRLPSGAARWMVVEMTPGPKGRTKDGSILWTSRPIQEALLAGEVPDGDPRYGHWLWDPERFVTHASPTLAAMWGLSDDEPFEIKHLEAQLSEEALGKFRQVNQEALKNGLGYLSFTASVKGETRFFELTLERVYLLDGRRYLMGNIQMVEQGQQ